jgi:hypothetical protein
MKYAISQGEYAGLLNSMPSGNYRHGRVAPILKA